MINRRGDQFKLKTNRKLEQQLTNFAGMSRFVWNLALSLNLTRLQNKQQIMYYLELDFFSKLWKKSEEYGFLTACPSQVIQQTLKNLERAFKDCFDKNQPNKRLPKFKRRNAYEGFKYPQGFKIKDSRIFLPKIGWVKFHKSKNIIGKPKNVTVVKKIDGWYISIQSENKANTKPHPSKSIVGIDMGVAKFATLSTGEYIEPINAFKLYRKKLKRLQRSLARKVKFSNNWCKIKIKIKKIHLKISNCRRDFLHQTSHRISKNHAIIVLEDLKITNMSKSAKGDLDNPGTQVKAKSGLNLAILDQSWYEFKRQLTYKQEWRGGKVMLVNPKNTSITCPNSSCKHKSKNNRISQSEFVCEKCGYVNNADIVGAINILRAGHARLASGDIVDVSRQAQESLKRVAA